MNQVTVSERTLFRRINRKLAREDEKLCTARLYPGGYENTNLGRYYRIDAYRNAVVETHVDIEALGRKLGALAPRETVN